MTRRKNRLEAAASRLGLPISFAKLPERSGYDAGWYIVGVGGFQRYDFLAPTIDDAVVIFESRYDGAAYLGARGVA